jgi:hypothetical protein
MTGYEDEIKKCIQTLKAILSYIIIAVNFLDVYVSATVVAIFREVSNQSANVKY